MELIREPAVAGMFYPAGEKQLRDQLELLFEVVSDVEKFDNVFGVVSPHAGYAYSGKTAAAGYYALSDNSYKTAIILSPSHREYFPGISIFEGDAYKTPLGSAKVDKELRAKLVKRSKTIFSGNSGHKAEHALEVQIPFLQFLFPDIRILPVVLGDQSLIYVDELSNKLSEVVDDETLIVASSDLSHFYSRQEADKLDSIVANRISSFQFDELQDDLENRNCEACGGGNIVVLMKAADKLGKTKSKIIHRTDSGETTGDTSEVVGYLSAIVY